MKSGISLYLRVFLPFSATLVLTMLVAWWTATGLLTGTLEDRLHNQITHATEVIARGTFPFTRDLLVRIGTLQDAHFALLRADGSIGLSTFGVSEAASLAGLVEHVRAHPQQMFADHYAIAIVPLAVGRTSEYTAVAGLASLSLVQSASRRTALILGLLTLAGVAVAAWWGHRISNAITRPVRELAEVARRIAGGDRKLQPVQSRVQEIGELALALDDMTVRLGDYEQELLRANRLASLGEITSRVAHEIRNPLTAIKLQLQLLAERLRNHSEQTITRGLLAEVQRLELIAASTLAVGRPQTIETVRSSLNEAIEDVISLIRPQFQHLRIDLLTQLDTIIPIDLDSGRIKQVLFNLLTNAADALPDGGRVKISTTAGNAEVFLEVEDSGPGIISNRKTPGDSAAGAQGKKGSKPNGLGLGLVVSREIVELHGGSMTIDRSPSLGGARFTIRLPAPEAG